MQQSLSNLRVEKDYYTTKQLSELYHVTPQTICNWIRRGWIKADMMEPMSKDAKTTRGRYRIFPQVVDDIESHKDELIEASRRYWVSMLFKMRNRR